MNQALVEGIDYYVEDGKIVFSAAYHLKRGYCCNSKCRHCPFKGDAEPEVARIEIRAMPGLSGAGLALSRPRRGPK